MIILRSDLSRSKILIQKCTSHDLDGLCYLRAWRALIVSGEKRDSNSAGSGGTADGI